MLVLFRYGSPVTTTVPLLVDCDTGIDDALALLLACASPEADIRAVTCVAGNVDARQVGINTRAVLELAGRDDIEVALGREVPLLRSLVTTPETHGGQGLGDARLPPPSRELSTRHAVDLIIEEATAHPGELTLLTLGPMTNLAVAVLREPMLPRLLRRLVLMGGCVRRHRATPRRSRNGTSPWTPRRWRSCCAPGHPTARSRGATTRRRVRWRWVSTSPSRLASCPSTSSGSPRARDARRTACRSTGARHATRSWGSSPTPSPTTSGSTRRSMASGVPSSTIRSRSPPRSTRRS